MKNITIVLKDGRKIEHKHTGRPGGSYSKSVRYEVGFVVVVDEYGNEVAYPSTEVAEIKTENLRSGW
jgi:hypothetical protein